MATAKKTRSGSYRTLVYIGKDENGKRKYKSFTDTDKRRCERMASEYADIHREVLTGYRFKNAMLNYIRMNELVLSPSTIRGYTNISKFLSEKYPKFCELPVQDINQETLQTLINDMSRTLSPKTVKNRHGFITTVIRSKGYEPPCVKLPDKKKPILNIPDIDDVKLLLETAKDTDLEIPIMLGAFGALRRGEVIALRMEDIKGDTIHVCRSIVEDVDGNLIEKAPKTIDSDRYILMPGFVMDRIREKGCITTITKPRMLTLKFERLAEKCGLKGMRFHDLRHFSCSWLHSKGVPEKYILQRGGWATSNVMKEVYRHALASAEKSINQQILADMENDFGNA